MNNPVTEFRERLDLTRKEFSVLNGVVFSTLSNVESGNASIVAQKVIDGLRKAGIPWQELEDIQERYRRWLRDKVEQQIMKKREGERR